MSIKLSAIRKGYIYKGKDSVSANQHPIQINTFHPSRKKIRCVRISHTIRNKHINMSGLQYSI